MHFNFFFFFKPAIGFLAFFFFLAKTSLARLSCKELQRAYSSFSIKFFKAPSSTYIKNTLKKVFSRYTRRFRVDWSRFLLRKRRNKGFLDGNLEGKPRKLKTDRFLSSFLLPWLSRTLSFSRKKKKTGNKIFFVVVKSYAFFFGFNSFHSNNIFLLMSAPRN